MKLLFAALLLASMAFESSAAGATGTPGPIYRCGTEYSQTPCPNGRLLEVSDPRSAAQRAEAKRITAQERKQAAEMERDRKEQLAAESPASASGFNGRPPALQASAASAPTKQRKKKAKAKSAEPTDFKAVVPASQAKASQQ